MDKIQKKLRGIAEDQGVDLFGVADLTKAHDFVAAQGGELIGRFPRAVSLGVRLLDAVVDELSRHEHQAAIYAYRGLYNTVNASLDRAALYVAKGIQETGFKAYPIPSSQIIDSIKLQGIFSHKLAANLAGLGWIGKSCLLITPDHGPRVRLASVLTDAPMGSGTPLSAHCGECRKCVDVCPVKAFTGIPFNSSEPRDVRFQTHLCDEYSDRRKQLLGEGICGLCVHICPYGTARKSR